MSNERTITVPANATAVTFTLRDAAQVGQATPEARLPKATPIAVRKASGCTPLYKVIPTTGEFKGQSCGVFWEGPDNNRPNVKRIGIRKMLKNGSRMCKRSKYPNGKADFIDASDVR